MEEAERTDAVDRAGSRPFAVTKHGVVTLSETLHHELAERGTAPMDPVEAAGWETLRQQLQTDMPPAQVADAVFQAIREERFYILTHPEGNSHSDGGHPPGS
jgi:hypothetical protein